MRKLSVPLPEKQPGEEIIAPQAGPQTTFLACGADIVVYGGAAGGGKTWGLLLDALRYAALEPVPGFGAVIFRRTSPQITAQGGLWDESSKLYPLAGGKPNRTMLSWDWPHHNSRIRFAHMQYDQDMYNWQGSQIPHLGFDELTHFGETAFFYMLSRNRSTCGVKPRVRATVNPDPDSWVKRFLAPWVDPDAPWHAEAGQVLRFYRENDTTCWLRPGEALPPHIKPEHIKTATFIPAKLSDNPALLKVNPEYEANIMALPAIERERLLGGPLAWTLRQDGNTFKRPWFPVVDAAPVEGPEGLRAIVRRWDFAATEPRKGYSDPDYTAGVKLGITSEGVIYVLDCILERLSPADVQALVKQTAELDGRGVAVRWEIEPGSAGKTVSQMYARLLAGWDARGVHSTGDKLTRALPFAAQAEVGNVRMARGAWNEAWLNQLCAFPSAIIHDDAVDATAGAYSDLVNRGVSLADLQRRAALRQQAARHAAAGTSPTTGLAHPESASASDNPPTAPAPDGFFWPW
jgi:predicted phage terminase large subunit-like protein